MKITIRIFTLALALLMSVSSFGTVNILAETSKSESIMTWDEQEAHFKSLFEINGESSGFMETSRSRPQTQFAGFKISDYNNGKWLIEIYPRDVSLSWNDDDEIRVENPFSIDVSSRKNAIVLTVAKSEDYPDSAIVMFNIINETRRETGQMFINLSENGMPKFRSYSVAHRFVDMIPTNFRMPGNFIVTGEDDWVEMDIAGPGTRYPTEEEWNNHKRNLDSYSNLQVDGLSITYGNYIDNSDIFFKATFSDDGR